MTVRDGSQVSAGVLRGWSRGLLVVTLVVGAYYAVILIRGEKPNRAFPGAIIIPSILSVVLGKAARKREGSHPS
jgi:hypothetical protein